MAKKWTSKENEEFKRLYKVLSKKEIAKYFNVSESSVMNKANRLGVTASVNSKNRGNQKFFNVIDSQEKAYWLGFIYADGYVVYNPKSRNYELGIELNEVDREHLAKFNAIFNNYYRISERSRKCFETSETSMCNIRIYSKQIVEDLITQGIVPNKTHSEIFPMVEDEELFAHFLRGYIDGDGSYSVKNKKYNGLYKPYPRISIVGNNIKCFEYIQDRLFKMGIKSYINPDKNSWKLFISSKQGCLNLINILFKDANIYLDRKYEKKEVLKRIAV